MFNKLSSYFKNPIGKFKKFYNSFSAKLTTLFLIILILPLLLISIIFYKISSDTYSERLLHATRLTSHQLAQQIEERFTQLTRVSSIIEGYMPNFPNYLYGLSYNNAPTLTEQLDVFCTLRTNVNSLISSFALKNISIFLNDNSFFSNEGLTFFGLSDLKKFKIAEKYLSLSREKLTWLYVPDLQYPFILYKTYAPTRTILCIYTQITESDQVLNYAFFVSIDASEFDELISEAYSYTDVNGYLIDENGQVICSSLVQDSDHGRTFFLKKS